MFHKKLAIVFIFISFALSITAQESKVAVNGAYSACIIISTTLLFFMILCLYYGVHFSAKQNSIANSIVLSIISFKSVEYHKHCFTLYNSYSSFVLNGGYANEIIS
jgi:hypothetical protein